MYVKSMVSLSKVAEAKHVAVMREAADSLTTDKKSVQAFVSPEDDHAVMAEFVIEKARQMDVVDKIMHKFAENMHDYETQDVWFPKKPKKENKAKAPSHR